MDVGNWLRSLGLAQYETSFRDNEVDYTILSTLTAEDLKDLGVSLVGHRRKLLDATAVLRADGGAEKRPAREGAAERRQVTVLFSDIVGLNCTLRPYGS
jgi:class 3 adenylate cyclase